MGDPYRRSSRGAARTVAPRAPLWRILLALLSGLGPRLADRRRRLTLRALAETAPSTFAALVHAGVPSVTERDDRVTGVSPETAIRALRGCSGEKRDAVAQHVGDCLACRLLVELQTPPIAHGIPLRHQPGSFFIQPRTEGGPGGSALRGDAPSHAPAVRNPSPALGRPRW